MTKYSKKPHSGQVVDAKGTFEIIDCDSCGFRHVMPLPSSDSVTQIYEVEYYTEEKPDYFKKYEEDKDWWNLAYDDRLDVFEKELPSKPRRLLDIGSGPGLFLSRARDRGWQTVGIEPSKQAHAYATNIGLEIYNEFLTEDSLRLGIFDAIHLSLVLEHIPDPLAMLEMAYQMLVPGGLICVVVPNEYSPVQQAADATTNVGRWWVAPPHHLNYFNKETLKHCFNEIGFEVFKVSGTFPIDLFLLMGDNYIRDQTLGRECHKKRKFLEFSLAAAGKNQLRQKLYENLIGLDIGREIIMYGKRA